MPLGFGRTVAEFGVSGTPASHSGRFPSSRSIACFVPFRGLRAGLSELCLLRRHSEGARSILSSEIEQAAPGAAHHLRNGPPLRLHLRQFVGCNQWTREYLIEQLATDRLHLQVLLKNRHETAEFLGPLRLPRWVATPIEGVPA